MSAPAGPRVGCGAALVRGRDLLLVLRRRRPEAGCWGIPGGKVDPMEPVEEAMVREIREETGIVVGARRLLCVVDHIDREAGEHWVAPVYLVESWTGEPELREPEALAAIGWFPIDRPPAPLTRAAAAALAALRAAPLPRP
jgi:ADP-ribose pyrophosphatase YjhB (NUDIX family)